jgi:hypothetical protein
MVRLVRNTSESVFAAKNWKVEALLETNPLADWFDSSCCIAIGQKTYVGGLNDRADLKLYPSYAAYLSNTGSKPVAMRRFSKLLIDLVSSQLGYKSVRKLPRNEFGVAIADVILRDNTCAGYPFPISGNRDNPPNPPNGRGGGNCPKSPISPNSSFDGGLTVKSAELTVNLTDKTLADVGFDGSDGFFESGSNNLICEQNDAAEEFYSDRVLAMAAPKAVLAEVKSDLSSVPSNPSAVRVSSSSFTISQCEVYRQPVEEVAEEEVAEEEVSEEEVSEEEVSVEEVSEEEVSVEEVSVEEVSVEEVSVEEVSVEEVEKAITSEEEIVSALAGVLADEAICPDSTELAISGSTTPPLSSTLLASGFPQSAMHRLSNGQLS